MVRTAELFTVDLLTTKELQDAQGKMKDRKATGIDHLTAEIFKYGATVEILESVESFLVKLKCSKTTECS